MSYALTFFNSLPSVGWVVVSVLLILWGLLHTYEGFVESVYAESITRIKRLFKPLLLIVAAIMVIVALFSANFLSKNSVDKPLVDAAQLKIATQTKH